MDLKQLPLNEREELCYERLSTLREKKAKLENGIKTVSSTKIDNCSEEVISSIKEMKEKLESSLNLLIKQENDYLGILAHIKAMRKIHEEEDDKEDDEVTIEDVHQELKNIKDAMEKTEAASKINQQLMMTLKLQQQKRAALAGINLKKRQEQSIAADQATEEFLTAKKKFLTQKTEIERKNIQLEKLKREIVKRELLGRCDIDNESVVINKSNPDQQKCAEKVSTKSSKENDQKNKDIFNEIEPFVDEENCEMINDEEDDDEDEYSHLSLSEMKERRDAFNEQITTKLRVLEENKNRMRLIREKLIGLQKDSYKNMSQDNTKKPEDTKIEEPKESLDNKKKIDIDYEDALSRLQSLTSMRQRLELIHQNITEDGVIDKDVKIMSVPDIVLSEINEVVSSNKEMMDNYGKSNSTEKGNRASSPSPDAATPNCITNALDDPYHGGKDAQKYLNSTESSFDVTTIENVIKKGNKMEKNIRNDDESELISVVRKEFQNSMDKKNSVPSKLKHCGFSTSFSTINTSQDISDDKTPIGDTSTINEQLEKMEEILNMHSLKLEEISKQVNSFSATTNCHNSSGSVPPKSPITLPTNLNGELLKDLVTNLFTNASKEALRNFNEFLNKLCINQCLVGELSENVQKLIESCSHSSPDIKSFSKDSKSPSEEVLEDDGFDVKEMPLFKNDSPLLKKNSTYWSHGYWDAEEQEGLDFIDALRESQYDNCVNNETTKLSKMKTREKVLKFTSSLRKSSSEELTTSGETDSRNEYKNVENTRNEECSVVEEQIFFIVSSIIPFLNIQQQTSPTADLRFIADLRNLILNETRSIYCKNMDIKSSQTFTKQISSILDASLSSYIGCNISENRDQLILELSDVLHNELSFYNLINDINNVFIGK
uniref:PCM1_C domain-containing protein n=1 Tax=Strongyloides papillosus TaxID=174720 RepID=A0A0N5C7R3_STREA